MLKVYTHLPKASMHPGRTTQKQLRPVSLASTWPRRREMMYEAKQHRRKNGKHSSVGLCHSGRIFIFSRKSSSPKLKMEEQMLKVATIPKVEQ
jgi:hypothetical protein